MRYCALLGFVSLSLPGAVQAAPEKMVVEGVTYRVLSARPSAIRVVWKDDHGIALRTFPAVARFLMDKGVEPDTLMNGGIFGPGGNPLGFLIQDGKELNPVNRAEGEGNFFLQPNGIFLVGPSGAAIIRTGEYPLRDVTVLQAVQSGPLLLRRGKVHPAFNPTSTSRLHRNGAGVAKTGAVIFAITDLDSEKLPNLHEFAELFRTLGCEDALFLDGDLSQMISGDDLHKQSMYFGSVIAVIQAPAIKKGESGPPFPKDDSIPTPTPK